MCRYHHSNVHLWDLIRSWIFFQTPRRFRLILLRQQVKCIRWQKYTLFSIFFSPIVFSNEFLMKHELIVLNIPLMCWHHINLHAPIYSWVRDQLFQCFMSLMCSSCVFHLGLGRKMDNLSFSPRLIYYRERNVDHYIHEDIYIHLNNDDSYVGKKTRSRSLLPSPTSHAP